MAFLDETGLGHLWTRIMEKLGEKVGTSEVEALKSEIKAEILGAAPDELNTLEELAAALGEDENFSTTILNQIGQKPDYSDIPTIPEISTEMSLNHDFNGLDIITQLESSLKDETNTYEIKGASVVLKGDDSNINITPQASTGSYVVTHMGNSPTQNTNTTASPAHGESFEVLDSVGYDGKGHITSFTKKTVTLPSLEDIEVSYTHPYGTSLPTSGKVGDVFLLLES